MRSFGRNIFYLQRIREHWRINLIGTQLIFGQIHWHIHNHIRQSKTIPNTHHTLFLVMTSTIRIRLATITAIYLVKWIFQWSKPFGKRCILFMKMTNCRTCWLYWLEWHVCWFIIQFAFKSNWRDKQRGGDEKNVLEVTARMIFIILIVYVEHILAELVRMRSMNAVRHRHKHS